ncbi:MAG: molybdenum cofactor guanylyltransferase [Planctomycetota bacterium]|nr:molybdenum cofactor guanylyltransferase [Planctomycetota bacterium]
MGGLADGASDGGDSDGGDSDGGASDGGASALSRGEVDRPRAQVATGAAVPLEGAPYLGVVFAGGESRRMGQDKALLPWPSSAGGVTLMERAARALEALGCAVEVARGSRGAGEDIGRPVIHDVVEGAGPLAGLVASLERAEELGLAGVVALACDMPLVQADELRPLLRAVDGDSSEACRAAMWVVDHREQPLCAVYSLACLPAARAAFGAGKRRLVAIFDPDATGGHAPALKRLQPDQKTSIRLVNLNTMTDYDLAAKGDLSGGE